MRIALIGGAGFIGSNLAEVLALNGHNVSIFDNFDTGFAENLKEIDCDVIKGDLREPKSLKKFLGNGQFEFIIHLAALGSVPRSIEYPKKSFEVNVVGTLNLLEEIKEMKIPMLYTSSSSVYGSNTKLPKNEIDWMSPISPYGSFKLANESIIAAYSKSYKLDIQVFRLFNVYGPKQNPLGAYSAVIPRWIMSAFKREPIIVFGDGNQKRDFTFVEDVNDIFLRALVSEKRDLLPTNLAFGNPITLNNVLDIFNKYFKNLETRYVSKRDGDIQDSQSDPTKLFTMIGNFESTSIQIGLMRTFDWYKKKYRF